MVIDFKEYRTREGKPPTERWSILFVSHLLILAAGLVLGYWIAGRLAHKPLEMAPLGESRTSEAVVPLEEKKPHKTLTKNETEQALPQSGAVGNAGEKNPVETSEKSGVGVPVPQPDQRGKELKFTFYESLQKERIDSGLGSATGATGESKRTAGIQQPATNAAAAKPEIGQPGQQKTAPVAYFIQLGSFREEGTAKDFAEKLKAKGYPVEVPIKVLVNKNTLYRVRMGPFENEAEAKKKAEAIERGEKLKPFILSEQQNQSR